ncbi:MAG: AAA family ATPase, partial [Proteobacteria bacterium]|nr:AAA family ATPase [Pseudomonadota bacterium]
MSTPIRRPDTFIGRTTETGHLNRLFASDARLITIVGPGGTGKTRLAQHFASTADFNEVYFCDLSEARSVEGIVSAIAWEMDLTLAEDPLCQIDDILSARQNVLFILDNFEQVVTHGANTLGRWLQVAPQVRFIATSRIRLNIQGEQVVHLNPLGKEEAIELLKQRAKAIQVDFCLGESDMAVAADLVQRLDCLPLAIELAAPWVRILSLEQIHERLKNRFQLLKRGPTREETLR